MASSAFYTFAPEMMMEVWLSGLMRHTANVLNRLVPEVRILLLPQIGEVAQLDQSSCLRSENDNAKLYQIIIFQ